MLIESAHTELTSAILLVVESIFFKELVSPVLQSSFSPVLFPEDGAGIEGGGTASCFVYLVEAFPTGRGEGSGEQAETMSRGITGGLCQAVGEALQATVTTFRFIFHALHGATPLPVVIIAVDKIKSKVAGVTDGFVFPYFVLLLGVDIGVIVEQGRADVVGKQAFDDGRRTRSTTGVQQYFVLIVGSLKFQHSSLNFNIDLKKQIFITRI